MARGLQQVGEGNATCKLASPYGERRWWMNLHDAAGERVRVPPYQPRSGGCCSARWCARTVVGLAARDALLLGRV